MPQWNKHTGRYEDAGCYLSPSSPLGPCLLSSAELVEWERLTAWWLAWTPPTAPYAIDRAITVLDPALCHRYYAARIREGCTGQVKVATLSWLQKHWHQFGKESPHDPR